MPSFTALARELSARCGVRCEAAPAQRLGGAGASESYEWPCENGKLFVKVGPGERRPALEAEAAGLTELSRAQALRVPRVLASGATDDAAFLALEWIDAAPADSACARRLGEGLAALHAVTAPRFGWGRDNTIGRTSQTNGWMEEWAGFFRERRLRPQLDLAVENGFGKLVETPGERLLESVHLLLAGHAPRASLLHGDLWGGNWLATAEGEPVIVDPAVYYGDREADLAMTRLFGGFGAAFYREYEAADPLPPGAGLRRDLYNLYHVLNHANLFGGGYARQARDMIDRLLAEVRS
jgi:protein-ribulosamine 3-kinase